jgi:hypothetical protein
MFPIRPESRPQTFIVFFAKQITLDIRSYNDQMHLQERIASAIFLTETHRACEAPLH